MERYQINKIRSRRLLHNLNKIRAKETSTLDCIHQELIQKQLEYKQTIQEQNNKASELWKTINQALRKRRNIIKVEMETVFKNFEKDYKRQRKRVMKMRKGDQTQKVQCCVPQRKDSQTQKVKNCIPQKKGEKQQPCQEVRKRTGNQVNHLKKETDPKVQVSQDLEEMKVEMKKFKRELNQQKRRLKRKIRYIQRQRIKYQEGFDRMEREILEKLTGVQQRADLYKKHLLKDWGMTVKRLYKRLGQTYPSKGQKK